MASHKFARMRFLWFCTAVIVFTSPLLAALDGALSKEDLAKLYQHYFAVKDAEKLGSLVYWPGVAPKEREAFSRSLKYDLQYRVINVKFTELEKSQQLEYSVGGTIFRPTLRPVALMVVIYEGHDDVKKLSTTYLIGKVENRYYITLASPAAK